jgi:hypothetical protein
MPRAYPPPPIHHQIESVNQRRREEFFSRLLAASLDHFSIGELKPAQHCAVAHGWLEQMSTAAGAWRSPIAEVIFFATCRTCDSLSWARQRDELPILKITQ